MSVQSGIIASMITESHTESTLPLAGKTIVVTRALAQSRSLADGLSALGASITEFPTIEVKLVQPEISFYVDAFDWIVFTSANGVRGLRHTLEVFGQSFCMPSPSICAVGPATERTLQADGIEVNLVPEIYSAKGVYEALKARVGDVEGKSFLLPQGNIARNTLEEALTADGAEVIAVEVYETRMPETDFAQTEELLAASPDLVTFTSGSTARNFVKLGGSDALPFVDYASIGPFTTKVAESCGLKIAVEPEQHDIPGLIKAITNFYTET